METPADDSSSTGPAASVPRSLDRLERRVLGVLVEKAKTTPEAYPLSLNALTTGCNQKSNRDPQMNLTPAEVEETLERLRQLGAVAEVQGGGRVARYRHYLYEFLGVERAELGVMAELLLRGAQSVGELRGRAARMESIADVAALMPILASLTRKQLVLPLSPPGRGQIVTHNLYRAEELEKVRRKLGLSAEGTYSLASADETTGSHDSSHDSSHDELRSDNIGRARAPSTSRWLDEPSGKSQSVGEDHLADFRQQLESLREEVATIRRTVDDLRSQLGV